MAHIHCFHNGAFLLWNQAVCIILYVLFSQWHSPFYTEEALQQVESFPDSDEINSSSDEDCER